MTGPCDFTLLQGGLSDNAAGNINLTGGITAYREKAFDLIIIGIVIIILMLGFKD